MSTCYESRAAISGDENQGKRKVASKNGGAELSTKGDGFLSTIDAIARGVEARHELITGHSRRITEETMVIARALGIPENEIEEWASLRVNGETERIKAIGPLLKMLYGSQLAGESGKTGI